MTGQQLKNSILQLAVQGKLVPQDPADEPASQLLARIREEKEQLIREKKIKREKNPSQIFRGDDGHFYERIGKNEPVCIDEELPFEIPETWEWARLGAIFQHNTGKALNSSNQSGQQLPYITTSNLYWGYFQLDNLREMYFTESELEKCTVKAGDLLVCEGGDIGRSAIWTYDFPIRIQNHIHRLRPYIKLCLEFYYYLFYYYKQVNLIGGKGIGIKGLSTKAIHTILFPVPPLAEQIRIANKLTTFKPQIDDYCKIENKLNLLNTTFPDQLKKSILQEAIQGKLVPQDPADEPASALLERIRAEKEQLIKDGKIKREKNPSQIFRGEDGHFYERVGKNEPVCIDEELPFEIPETWEWTRLQELATKIGSGSTPTGGRAVYVTSGIKFIRSQNVYNDGLHLNDVAYIPDEINAKKPNSIVQAKDILLNITGGSIGRCAIVPDDFDIANINQHVMIIRQIDPALRFWIHSVLISNYIQDLIMDVQVGVSREGLSATKIKAFFIPMPPLAEQQHIIEKLEQLNVFIDQLTKS